MNLDDVAALKRQLDEWRDYWGCDSPHDSHITIGSLNPYARQLGNEQARANTAENRLARVEQERDEANTALANEMRAHTGTLDARDALKQENAELTKGITKWAQESVQVGIRLEATISENAELRADRQRLNKMIELLNCWDIEALETFWDNLPGDSDNMYAEVRAAIDAVPDLSEES